MLEMRSRISVDGQSFTWSSSSSMVSSKPSTIVEEPLGDLVDDDVQAQAGR